MKYMQYAVMAVCGFLVSLPLQADHEVLDVVYSDQWPPYSYSNEQGQPDGILVHLVDRLLGQQLKIPLKHHILPWKRAQKLVEQGHFDAMMAVPTPDRLLYAERTQSVLYQFKVQAFVSKRSPRAETILQAENPLRVTGIDCVVMLGDKTSEAIYKKEGLDCIKVGSAKQALGMLRAGRADLLIHGHAAVMEVMPADDIPGRIVVHEKVLSAVPSVLLVSKHSPFAGSLVKQLDLLIETEELVIP